MFQDFSYTRTNQTKALLLTHPIVVLHVAPPDRHNQNEILIPWPSDTEVDEVGAVPKRWKRYEFVFIAAEDNEGSFEAT